MVIFGGGICGILAAKQCHDRGMKYVVVEKEAKLGGVWHTMANGTSFLQVSYFIGSIAIYMQLNRIIGSLRIHSAHTAVSLVK